MRSTLWLLGVLWRALRRLLDRQSRRVAMLPYLGQPIWINKKGNLVVFPRRTLRRRWRVRKPIWQKSQ